MSFQILANCFCHPRFGFGMGFLMYQVRDDIILSWILNFKILGPSGNEKVPIHIEKTGSRLSK